MNQTHEHRWRFQRVVKVARVSTGENPVVCVICAMKPRHSFVSKVLLILAFACTISIGTVAQGSPPSGRLIVQRVPNFGWNLAFHLQIDGRSVANIVQGDRYDGWVPAGRHVLTVYKVPYQGYAEPASTTVNVQPGATYVYTAMWDSDYVFLRPSSVCLTPGELWQLGWPGRPWCVGTTSENFTRQ